MTDDATPTWVWIFNGTRASFPSAVFATRESADVWIAKTGVEGTLTRYPVGVSVYDWAIGLGYFTPKRDEHRTPDFIGRFTSASLDHDHVGPHVDTDDDAGPGSGSGSPPP